VEQRRPAEELQRGHLLDLLGDLRVDHRGEEEHDGSQVNHKAKTTVEAAAAFDARVRNQITGSSLKDFGTRIVDGTVPVVGGMCPGSQGADGEWIAVEMTSSTDSGLMVHYGDLAPRTLAAPAGSPFRFDIHRSPAVARSERQVGYRLLG
jgi:hypothetical protein